MNGDSAPEDLKLTLNIIDFRKHIWSGEHMKTGKLKRFLNFMFFSSVKVTKQKQQLHHNHRLS